MRDSNKVSQFDLMNALARDEERAEEVQETPRSGFDVMREDAVPRERFRSPPSQFDLMVQAVEPQRDVTTPVANSRQDKLSKRDLLSSENMSVIRNYMTRRYGQDMLDRYDTDEKLMERYVDSLRFFNGNLLGTVGEATWVADADDASKQAANDAYELFDRLGNVFTVDGVGGALDGIKDYVFAAARDPSNYAGLFTGGAAKASTLGSQLAVKTALRRAASEAGRRAAKEGFDITAQKKAVAEAVERTLDQIGDRAITEQSKKRLLNLAEENAKRAYEARLRADGRQEALDRIAKQGLFRRGKTSKRANIAELGETGAMAAGFGVDALAAAVQDNLIQNTMIEVGAQERYSAAQTAIGAIVGGLTAPGLKLVGDFVGSKLGRRVSAGDVAASRIESETRDAASLVLDEEEHFKVVEEITNAAKTWKQKVEDGIASGYDKVRVPEKFFTDLVFGDEEGKIKGLMSIFNEKGLTVPGNVRVTDFFTNLIRDLDDTEMKTVVDELKGLDIQLDDVMNGRENLGDLWASKVSQAASLLSVSSRIRRTLNLGMAQAERTIQEQAEELVEEAGGRKQYGAYAQSLWRRMLVSNPATSMINVAGFGMYYGSQGIAEVLATAPLALQGVVANARGKDGSKYFRQARHLFDMQHQKMLNLLDPHATRANFEELLEEVDGARNVLLDNLTGGVDATATRYNFDPNDVKATENLANLAAKLTMVRAQDSVTKSQMFMAEMDKRLRLKYDRTLDDVMRSGDLSLIDSKMTNQVMDDTLASVFSRNYTIEENNPSPLLRDMASLVERFSNTPLLGQILPFGRFFNNVLGNTYRFGFAGIARPISDAMKGDITTDTYEAFGRTAVALAFFGAAAEYDKQRQEDDLGMFQIRVGDSIYDAENSFPLSLFLAAGRLANDKEASGEQYLKIFEQLAVGQFASDVQFDNTLRSIANTLASQDVTSREKFFESLSRGTGGFISGYTRPLDALNKVVGAATGTDYVRDQRQATSTTESFTYSATKYIDNIVEGIMKQVGQEDVPLITGKTYRTALREGDLRTPNAALSLLGIRQEPTRTAAEAIVDSVDMPRYEQNIYSKNPRYDRIANTFLNGVLERRLSNLRDSERFQRMGDEDKRTLIKQEVRIARDFMRDMISNEQYTNKNIYIETLRKKAMDVQSRGARNYARQKMQERHGVSAPLTDYSLPELQSYLFYADSYDEVLKYR